MDWLKSITDPEEQLVNNLIEYFLQSLDEVELSNSILRCLKYVILI